MKVNNDTNEIENRLIKIFNNARDEMKEKIAFSIFCADHISQKPNDILKLWKIANKNERQKFYDIAEITLKTDIKKLKEK